MIFKKKSEEQKTNKESKFKRIFKSKKSLTIFIIACVLVIGLVGFLAYHFIFKSKKAQSTTTEAQVTRGSIQNVIEGTGTVEAKAQYEVKYLNSVDVVADYFEEGDYVEADQILYQMDAEDIERNITKQRRNVEKAQMNYDDILESISDLNVKSDINGVITNLYVSKGDNVSNGTKIADVVDKDTLLVTIPFGADDAKNIYVGQSAEVTLMDSLTPLWGRVTNVASGTYVNSYRVEVTDVEIEVSNPAAVTEGEIATATVGSYACYDSAPLEYANAKTIVSRTSGEVVSISKKKGDLVNSGNTILTLESNNSDKSLREARISLEDAQSSLDQLLETRDDATIRSEISGKVIQKNIKAGEILDSNTSSTMAIIADLSSLKFSISIDELDISKISVGQEVTITADALAGQTFKGSVSNISIIGTAFQGVTSYPVTVTIDNTNESDLIPGMNVEAKIIIDSVDNVLRVPVSALRMGNLVIVKDDGTFADPLEMDMTSFMQRPGGNTQEKSGEKSESKEEKSDDAVAPEVPQKAEGQGADIGGNTPDRGMQKDMAPTRGQKPTSDADTKPDGAKTQGEKAPQNHRMSESDMKKMQEEQKKRLKSMIDNLDVPEGYTVVRVQTGLNDGTFVEIKEIEGSLKEGDTVLIPVVINNNQSTQQQMPAGFGGGMPGGMQGGFRAGGMSGGMSGGMRSGTMSGGMRSGSMR